jgi:hypothetical protein
VTAQVRAGPDVHAIGNLAVVINRRGRVHDDVTSHTRAAIYHAACHNDGAFSDFNVPSDRGCGMNDDSEPAATFDKPRGDLHSDVIVADGYDTRTDFRLSRYQIVAAAYDFISHYLRPMFFHGVIADVRDHVTPFTLDRVDHNLGMAARAENENLLALIHFQMMVNRGRGARPGCDTPWCSTNLTIDVSGMRRPSGQRHA